MISYRYDREDVQATLGSIKKWEDILKGIIHDKGSENCPLCVWNSKENCFTADLIVDCKTCPILHFSERRYCEKNPSEIYHITDLYYCEETPYQAFSIHDGSCIEAMEDCETCQSLAKDEIEYLKKVLKHVLTFLII